jgi:hypothetical protein
MWDKIFKLEVIDLIIRLSEQTEDKNTIKQFREFVEAELDYKTVVVSAMQWHMHDDVRQANLAIHYVGEFHASRYVLLMDSLSRLIKEGTLK